jgi:hypothetical protein
MLELSFIYRHKNCATVFTSFSRLIGIYFELLTENWLRPYQSTTFYVNLICLPIYTI